MGNSSRIVCCQLPDCRKCLGFRDMTSLGSRKIFGMRRMCFPYRGPWEGWPRRLQRCYVASKTSPKNVQKRPRVQEGTPKENKMESQKEMESNGGLKAKDSNRQDATGHGPKCQGPTSLGPKPEGNTFQKPFSVIDYILSVTDCFLSERQMTPISQRLTNNVSDGQHFVSV